MEECQQVASFCGRVQILMPHSPLRTTAGASVLWKNPERIRAESRPRLASGNALMSRKAPTVVSIASAASTMARASVGLGARTGSVRCRDRTRARWQRRCVGTRREHQE
jgi:hypothetical protein